MARIYFNRYSCINRVKTVMVLLGLNCDSGGQLYSVKIVDALKYPPHDNANSIVGWLYVYKIRAYHHRHFRSGGQILVERQTADFGIDGAILNFTGQEIGGADKLGDKGGGWSMENDFRRVDLLQSSRIHHANAVTHEERLLLVMGYENDGSPGAIQDVFDVTPYPYP